jgi:hypothetical protein
MLEVVTLPYEKIYIFYVSLSLEELSRTRASAVARRTES